MSHAAVNGTTGGRTARAILLYVVLAVGLVAGAGWLMAQWLRAPADTAAIRTSGIVAVVVQVLAFVAVRLMPPNRMLVGWGVGSLLRLATLVIYGLLAVKILALPAVAALLSLAVFFFLTTLVEPLLLRL